jgi:HK97 family phage major capsid protein
MEAAHAQAKQARVELQKARDAAEADKNLKPGSATFQELEKRNEEYRAASALYTQLSESYRALLDADNDLESQAGRSPFTTSASSDVQGAGTRDGWAAETARRLIDRQALDVTAGGGTVVPSFFDPTLRTGGWPSRAVQGLIPHKQVDTPYVHTVQEKVSSRSNAADVVPVGDTKPTSTVSIERVDIEIETIATMSEPVPNVLFRDYEGLETWLGSQLREMVLGRFEDLCITGDVSTPPEWDGLLETVTSNQPLGGDTIPDAILVALDEVRTHVFEPTAVVASLADARKLRTAKDDNGQYLFGPPSQAGAPGAWGVRLVPSLYMPDKTILVGDFESGAVIYDLDAEIRIFDQGYVDAATDYDLATKNEVRLRVEMRSRLHIPFPSAFCTVTLP